MADTTATVDDTGYDTGLDRDASDYQDVLDAPILLDNAVDDDRTQGVCVLFDYKECKVSWNSNQVPTLQLIYPSSGKFVSKLQAEKVILGDINRILTHQKFRITDVVNTDQDVTVNATHIIGEYLAKNPIKGENITAANVSASYLLGQILGHLAKEVPEINYDSDVSKVVNVNIDTSSTDALNAILDPDQQGDKPANSVLAQFGGDFYFDNTTIYHRENAGRDTNITVKYGSNLNSYSQEKNIADMYVGIYPFANYDPGPALATADNVDWAGIASQDTTSVASVTYSAAGGVDIYSAPVKGGTVVGRLGNGDQISLGKPISDGQMVASSTKPGAQLQVNTINGDQWYPVLSPIIGWIDGTFINFDKTGDYVVNNVVGHIHTAISSSGALIRYPVKGTGTVSYTQGNKKIHIYYSPDQGPGHYRLKDKNGKEKTLKNGQKLKYTHVEKDENGHLWYRIGPHQWVYGDHFTTNKDGDVQVYDSQGYGLIKKGAKKYYINTKTGKVTQPHEHLSLTAARKQHKKKYKIVYRGKGKHRKPHRIPNPDYQVGKPLKQKHKYYNLNYGQVRVGGVLYYKLSDGSYVKASDIDTHASKTRKPDSPEKIINRITKDKGKIEMYSEPSKGAAENWSVPAGQPFDITKSAQGADGKTWYQITYAGHTGWIPAEYTSSSAAEDLEPEAPDDSHNSYDDSDDSAIPTIADQTVHVELTDDLDGVVNGVLYPQDMTIPPENTHIMKLDMSNYIKHNDQDLSGLQDDGTYKATADDIQQLYSAALGALKEYDIGTIPISMTVSYSDLDGTKADLLALNMYDRVNVDFSKFDKIEQGKITGTVWLMRGEDSCYESVTIGDPPKTWQHLLLEQADKQAESRVSRSTGHMTGLLSRFDHILSEEGSNRIAGERKLMDDLGLIQHQVDQNGHDIATQLVKTKDFENQMKEIQSFADDMKDWVTNGGSGVIQAVPNWQEPTMLTASTGNGGKMAFSGNGLVFYDANGNQEPRAGMDSEGRIYADAIKAGTIEAVNIKSCLVESALTIGTSGGSMNVYIGTNNPRSILNPWKGGNVIWAMSDNYQSMMSSGQFATTNGSDYTRIHPSAITVGDDRNEVLTQRNFAAHAYRRIKSWVKLWIADWVTINGKRHYIWKGTDKSAYMGKLRNLAGQGSTDYSYSPGSDDDYGEDGIIDGDGTNLGDLATYGDLQIVQNGFNSQINSLQQQISSITITTPDPPSSIPSISTNQNPTSSDSTSGMLTYTEAWQLGLGDKGGYYPEAVGTAKYGNDGNVYVLETYTGTGNKHWYKASGFVVVND